MGDNGDNGRSEIVPAGPGQPAGSGLTEEYTLETDRRLVCNAIGNGWLDDAPEKYRAAMQCLHDIMAGKIEARPSLRLRAVKILLEVSEHTAAVLAPPPVVQVQDQQQATVVNVGSPDGPLAQMRARWAEKGSPDAG